MRWFFNGIVFTLAVLGGAALVAVFAGAIPVGADAKAPALETWAARTSLHAAIGRDGRGLTNPLQPTEANLKDGVKLYGANCAVCHGAADAKQSILSKGFYIEAPQLAKDGVEDDPDGVTFWKLKHGIRFSAMPAFAPALSDEDLWKIALFLKHMDKLPPAVDAAWKAVPSVAPAPAATP